jgi:hypothetical protein
MSTGVLWPALYQGDGTRIRKWLYGSVLVRDWDPAGSTAMQNIPVFTTDGNLNPALLQPVSASGYGFYDVGSITENGVEFNPKFSVDDTKIWQSRKSQRTDITEDDEEVMFSCSETTPLIDYLWRNLPIGFTGVPAFPSVGSAGYMVEKPFYSDTVYRQLLVIGVDGAIGPNGQPEYAIEMRPRVSLSKKSKKQWAAKQVDVTELTYMSHVDPATGTDALTLRGGIVWLDEGGAVTLPTVTTLTATANAGGKATLTFAQPTSPNQPFTYVVTQQVGGTGAYTTSTILTQSTTGDTVTVQVSGLTTGSAYTFKVVATAANAASAPYPAASNSVTALA